MWSEKTRQSFHSKGSLGVVSLWWFKPVLSAKGHCLPSGYLLFFLFEELVFSFSCPLLTSESTNTVLWEEDEDAVASTKLRGQDKKKKKKKLSEQLESVIQTIADTESDPLCVHVCRDDKHKHNISMRSYSSGKMFISNLTSNEDAALTDGFMQRLLMENMADGWKIWRK